MEITLPDGSTVTLYAKSEITERADRAITRTFVAADAVSKQMVAEGFVPEDISTHHIYTALSDADVDALNGYQAALITGIVKDHPQPWPGDPLDLPKPVFELLAGKCLEVYSEGLDFSPDAMLDPKAPPANSAG